MGDLNIFWFRRDLRLEDNHGLFRALESGKPVQCIFIFDPEILDKLEDPQDRRVSFIHHQLDVLNTELHKHGGTLKVYHQSPIECFENLLKNNGIGAVYTNNDYEPYARTRDEQVHTLLSKHNVSFCAFKDHVIHETKEVLKSDGNPYQVYTPYARAWKSTLQVNSFDSFPSSDKLDIIHRDAQEAIPPLSKIGFEEHRQDWPSNTIDESIIKEYHKTRDTPAVLGTSHLSVHLRFGTISIRKLMRYASITNEKWYNELIWREFYQMILWNFPHVSKSSFKPTYDRIPWRNNEREFEAWCEGKTGFPIVDAGMRELNATGFMHNRVRMITSSFLTRDLLIDWRWGEAYFASKLLDFDLASNNGGWQWAAGCGVDAAPYFRVFNPTTQAEKFDPDQIYIRKWVPELEEASYPQPIVDHKMARLRALVVYKKALAS